MNKRVFITGASGSIGSALALYYAREGYDLLLHGRSLSRLQPVIDQSEQLGARVSVWIADLADAEAVIQKTEQLLAEQVPDIFIANAGVNINHGRDNAGEKPEDISRLLDVNIRAVMLMTNLIGQAMRSRGQGQIALVSSLAGFYGLPVTPAYSASKAAIKAYGEGMRGWLASAGVGLTVIMPGYIHSDMCRQMPGPKPFLMTPDKAARLMASGISRNRARVTFPFPLNLGTWFLAVLPAGISQWILKKLDYGC